MTDREYLEKRAREERARERTAATRSAVQAHGEMAAEYERRLAALGDTAQG